MLVLEKDMSAGIEDTIYVFSLHDLNLGNENFIQELKDSFDDLEWDHYEFKRQQINFLKDHLDIENKEEVLEGFLDDYYENKHKEEVLEGFLQLLSAEELTQFQAIKYRRKRAIGYFSATKKDQVVEIKTEPFRPFTQSSSSYYPKERIFREVSEEIKNHPSVHALLRHFTSIMFEENPEKTAVDICMHQTNSICYPEYPGSGAPEGIHQDGMDYIVSALVIERENIKGGTSKLYYPGPNVENEVYSRTLVEGEGIFQADDCTQIWHDVTPIKPADNTKNGKRNTIGFDFKFR